MGGARVHMGALRRDLSRGLFPRVCFPGVCFPRGLLPRALFRRCLFARLFPRGSVSQNRGLACDPQVDGWVCVGMRMPAYMGWPQPSGTYPVTKIDSLILGDLRPQEFGLHGRPEGFAPLAFLVLIVFGPRALSTPIPPPITPSS